MAIPLQHFSDNRKGRVFLLSPLPSFLHLVMPGAWRVQNLKKTVSMVILLLSTQTVFCSFWSELMLFIAFMLNILKIRFDFLCSDSVLSGKWKVKTQYEETLFFFATTLSGRKEMHFRGKKITGHREMDAGVWKLGYACMHLNVKSLPWEEMILILPYAEGGIS